MKPPSPMLLRALRASTLERPIAPNPCRHHSRAFTRGGRDSQLAATTSTTSTTSVAQSATGAGARFLSTTSSRSFPPEARTPNLAPKTKDRGPASKEDTQTDFGTMNVLGNTPPPATAVDACLTDGFHLSNGVKIMDGSGCLLVAGEVFGWRPWAAGDKEEAQPNRNVMLNGKKQWEVPEEAWGLLELVWPRPELLILGLGGGLYPLSPRTKQQVNNLGIRVDILDTRNAAAQFNLLATERGVGNVAAALLPIGWKA